VVAYLAEEPLKNSSSLIDPYYISAEVFCSENMIYDAVKGKLASETTKDLFGLIDDPLIMRSYFRITDRMMSVPGSAVRRCHLLRLTVAFWLTIIDELKIEAIWFSSTPHFGYDTILALLADRKGIKVFIAHRTEFSSVHLIASGIDSEEYLQRTTPAQLKLNPTWIGYSKRLNSDSLVHNRRLDKSFVYRLLTFLRFSRTMIWSVGLMLLQSRWYRGFSSIYMTSSRLATYLPTLVYRAVQSRRLWREYREVSTVELPEAYVFFPWSFQPERSTDPEAGKFADLELCVHYLLRELPQNWSLVVKEHPRQFDGRIIDLRKLHFRVQGVYRRLNKLDRVVLADLSLDSTDLAKKAIACVTTTGSIGFEALKMGMRAGCFGRPWYAGLKHCYAIDTVEGLKRFYRALLSEENTGQTENFEKRLIDYLSNYSFIFPNFKAKQADFPPEAIDRMAEVLATALCIGEVAPLEEID
jgi:hypothetical protein